MRSKGGGSTAVTRLTFEDRALRGCSQNCVAISVALLSDPSNERIFRIIGKCTAPVLERDTQQRAFLKDASSCQKFMAQQSSGGYMKHVGEVAAAPQKLSNLEDCPPGTPPPRSPPTIAS